MPSPDAIILCGGAGLRLRSINADAPKAMARVAGRPFLELLLRQLRRHKFQRVVLAVGYQRDVIRSHFGDCAFDLHVEYSDEPRPLGTGGALRNAVKLIKSDSCLIMNGDSYTDADLLTFVNEHSRTQADVSLVVVPTDGREDCGSVFADNDGCLVRFEEKTTRVGCSYLSAGIYIVARHLLCTIPSDVPISLEKELFPRWLAEGKEMRVSGSSTRCVDIGTPERYLIAQTLLADVELGNNVPGAPPEAFVEA